MLLWMVNMDLKASITVGEQPAAVQTRSSNPMIVHVGRMMVRALPFIILLVP